MAVKGKGKEIDTPSSSKRPRNASTSAAGSKRRRSGVLQFVDDAAYVAEDDEDEFEDDVESDDDYGDLLEEIAKEGETPMDVPKGKGKGFLPFLVKEEQLSGDELEELIRERYGCRSGSKYAGNEDKFKDMAGPDPTKDPTIWRLKCGVGRERQVAFCFMQKYVEFHNRGNKLQIFSAFVLDHVKGYVYVEADKACDVTEACKGFCNVYVARINAVPASEVPHLLAIRSKPSVVSEGAWVRLKSGNYKGDIAQVVSVDDARKKVLLKLVPRIDLRAISQKFGGAISLKNAAIPTARLINPRELEEFRPHIEVRRDRQSGETFEVLDGNMLKDGYLFKRVSLNSLIYWGVEPTDSERVKFSPPSMEGQDVDPEEWVSDLYDSRRKKKSRASASADPKASTSEPMEDSQFGIHDLVLFGKKDFGVILGVEKDGLYKILTGDMEGIPVVTIKKNEIKKVCVDKMFTALDRKKKTLSINDPVDVSEGPTEGKKGVVKHLFKGVLFIHDEGEAENSGFFCAKAEHCVNTKSVEEAPPPPMQSFPENPDDSAGPSFLPSSPGPFQSFDQQDNACGSGRRRQQRESLFSIGQTLRIKKGPLKGYLCRVVRMYRNDITVKLDSLVKILTDGLLALVEIPQPKPRDSTECLSMNAEYLTVPTKRGQADDSGAAGASDIFGVQGTEGGSSWDTGLPSFTSDAWQPFSSSTAPTSARGEDGAGVDDDPWGTKVPSVTMTDAWNSDKPSDPWGKASDEQAADSGTSTQNDTWHKDDDSTGGNNSSQKKMDNDSGWENDKGKDAVSVDPWGTAASKGREEVANAWCQANNASSNEPSKSELWDSKGKGIVTSEDAWGCQSDMWAKPKEKGEAESGGWDNTGSGTQVTSNNWDAKGKEIVNEDSVWGKITESQSTEKSDAWGQSTEKGGDGEGGGGWNSGGNASWDKPKSSTWNSGLDDGDKGNKPTDSWNSGGGFEGRGGRGGRGGNGSGRGDCYKCGQSGHFARECPSSGGGGSRGGGSSCYKCGESGHFARECPSADGGGSRNGGGVGNCFKCGESGHFSRECPSANGGGSRGGGGNCYKCGESGHFARECPSAEIGGSRGGGGGGRDCFKCGKPGHFARECPGDGGAGGGTWNSGRSEKPSFGSSWNNDQAGNKTWGKKPETWSSESNKGWDNSQAAVEKKTDLSSSSWSKDVSGKEATGGADNWNAPTPPAPEEPQGDDPWAGNLAPAGSTQTTNDALDASMEDKSKENNPWASNKKTEDNPWGSNQRFKEHDPWGSNQKTEASSFKTGAKEADPWSTKQTDDTGCGNQDDQWSTKETDNKRTSNDTSGWNAGGSSQTQSDNWGKSQIDYDWGKPRASFTGANDDNSNDATGWGRPNWSSDSGGRGRGRGRGRNFGDRNNNNNGGRDGRGNDNTNDGSGWGRPNWSSDSEGCGRYFGNGNDSNNGGDKDDGINGGGGGGGNWRGRGGGWYGSSRGGRGGRDGSGRSITGNGDENRSFGGSSWNREENRPFGGSGGRSWSVDNDSKKSSDWGGGWDSTGGEKEKGNSWNDVPSFSAWNQGSTEKGSGWGNAGEEQKGKSGEGGGSAWDKSSGGDNGGWDEGGNGGNSSGW